MYFVDDFLLLKYFYIVTALQFVLLTYTLENRFTLNGISLKYDTKSNLLNTMFTI